MTITRSLSVALLSIFLVGGVLSAIFSIDIQKASSGSGDNLSGFAWSDTIGWISMNSTSDGSATNYGVNVAPGGTLSGYAWSEHIGWVSFQESAGCPQGTCRPTLNQTTGEVMGWAKALTASGGWDGWISLNCANIGACGTSNYKVSVTNCAWSGWAWGSDVVGWINFGGDGGTVSGTGDACISPNLNAKQPLYIGTVNAGATVTFTSDVSNTGTGVAGPYNIRFYVDTDGNGTAEYTLSDLRELSNTNSGGIESESVNWTVPVTATSGTWRVGYHADVTNEVPEIPPDGAWANWSGWRQFSVSVPNASCPAATLVNCSLVATPNGGVDGSCVAGGSCQYTCTNGTWVLNSNTCMQTSGSCTGAMPASPQATPCSATSPVSNTPYSIVASCGTSPTKCLYTCDPGYRTNSTATDCVATQCNDGVNNDIEDTDIDGLDTGCLDINGIVNINDNSEALVVTVPVLNARPRVVSQGGTTTLEWNSSGVLETTCTFTANTNDITVAALTGDTNPSPLSGSYDVAPVNVRTTYTVNCGGLSDSVTVEVQGYGTES